MRVLITGFNGFVGAHLAARLERFGDEVWGFAADAEPSSGDESSRFERLDVLDLESLKVLIARCDPEVIVHLAGLSHVGASWEHPGDYYRVNFLGTRNVLSAGGNRKLLFASSSEVYGSVPDQDQPLGEQRTLDPRSPYALTKACAEELAIESGAIVVRSFSAIGSGQGPTFALPSFARQLARIAAGDAPPCLRVGNLEPRRDFVHIDDIASGYEVLIRNGQRGEVYNLASGTALSIREVLEMLIDVSGLEVEIVVDDQRVRAVDIPLLCGDPRRLSALGWRPHKTVREAVTELWHEIIG